MIYPPALGKSATTRERPMQEDGEEEEASAEAEDGNGGGGESETPSSAAHRRSASIVGGRLGFTLCVRGAGVYAITVTGSRRLRRSLGNSEVLGKFRSSYAHFCTFCFTFRTVSKFYHLKFTFKTRNSDSNRY